MMGANKSKTLGYELEIRVRELVNSRNQTPKRLKHDRTHFYVLSMNQDSTVLCAANLETGSCSLKSKEVQMCCLKLSPMEVICLLFALWFWGSVFRNT